MNRRKFLTAGSISLAAAAYGNDLHNTPKSCNVHAWYIPKYFQSAPNYLTLHVRDTDSALGRYNKQGNIKEMTINDVVKYHGHLCDGVVFSFLQLSVGLSKLFPDGVIDRTDIAGVCKNSPCMVDTLSYLTGAKINFQTLCIDASAGTAHIIQKISTGETYKVSLAEGMFSKELYEAEKMIKARQKKGIEVLPSQIDKAEKLADVFTYKMMHTPLEKLVKVEKLTNYQFAPNEDVSAFGSRSDIKNKLVKRT